jgi:ketosteroid isomerase-like protein
MRVESATSRRDEKMRRVALTSFAIASLANPLGAQGAPPSAVPAAEQFPSVSLPPDLDRVLRDYERAWRANNIPGLVSLFTEDGFVLQPGRSPARGHAALSRVYDGQAGGMLRLRALAFASADTVGYIVGAYGYGEGPGDQGKFTLTLRRIGGRWLIASDMDNGNQSRRSPPPSS